MMGPNGKKLKRQVVPFTNHFKMQNSDTTPKDHELL